MTEPIYIRVPLVPPNPNGLCMCGCGGNTPIAKMTNRRQGCVAGYPQRFIMGHQSKLRQQFQIDAQTGCWNWLGYLDESGYGRATVGPGRSKQAHIVFFEKHVGKVKEGLELDHVCCNKRCVNPAHLEAVTHTENVRRQKQVKVSPELAKQIKAEFVPSPFGGRRGGNIKIMCAKFGVSRSQIYRIVRGESWS